ncbi:hypothetical protein M405DRAFT_845344 [Rhizopogon salebrosus TDB-379]|nr:hypothetical protein M405DRAFT_845344 [Rhizopogon salebrosus TDB-379]
MCVVVNTPRNPLEARSENAPYASILGLDAGALVVIGAVEHTDVRLVLKPLRRDGGRWWGGAGGCRSYSAGELHNTTDVRPEALDTLICRVHHFRTCAFPIKELTADILLLDVPWILISHQPESGDG